MKTKKDIIDAKKMLAVIEGTVASIAETHKHYLKNYVLKLKEVNDEMGQVFLVKYSHGHFPFHTREEAELFIKLIKK
jgi:hypothetical protein